MGIKGPIQGGGIGGRFMASGKPIKPDTKSVIRDDVSSTKHYLQPSFYSPYFQKKSFSPLDMATMTT